MHGVIRKSFLKQNDVFKAGKKCLVLRKPWENKRQINILCGHRDKISEYNLH